MVKVRIQHTGYYYSSGVVWCGVVLLFIFVSKPTSSSSSCGII